MKRSITIQTKKNNEYRYRIRCTNCNHLHELSIPKGCNALEYIRGNHDKRFGKIRQGSICSVCGCLIYSGCSVK